MERFVERIELEMLIEKNQLTDEEAWKLSEEVKADWWRENKDRMLKKVKTGESNR